MEIDLFLKPFLHLPFHYLLIIGKQRGGSSGGSWDWETEGKERGFQSSLQNFHASFHDDVRGWVGWSFSDHDNHSGCTRESNGSDNRWNYRSRNLHRLGGGWWKNYRPEDFSSHRWVIPRSQFQAEDNENLFAVTLVGGVVFILFAITSSIWDPNAESTVPQPQPGPGGNWDDSHLFTTSKALVERLNRTTFSNWVLLKRNDFPVHPLLFNLHVMLYTNFFGIVNIFMYPWSER